MAFGTQFRYFGKACTLEINGQVKIGKNVYIGDHVSLIVEQGHAYGIYGFCFSTAV
ncbi:hypothetical protein LTR94_012653 [Friedmanniomyces endolithicus]|nr:hypothetical protein LTR94_012653 [Friedmanniomyces endolithicus]